MGIEVTSFDFQQFWNSPSPIVQVSAKHQRLSSMLAATRRIRRQLTWWASDRWTSEGNIVQTNLTLFLIWHFSSSVACLPITCAYVTCLSSHLKSCHLDWIAPWLVGNPHEVPWLDQGKVGGVWRGVQLEGQVQKAEVGGKLLWLHFLGPLNWRADAYWRVELWEGVFGALVYRCTVCRTAFESLLSHCSVCS